MASSIHAIYSPIHIQTDDDQQMLSGGVVSRRGKIRTEEGDVLESNENQIEQEDTSPLPGWIGADEAVIKRE